MNDTRQLGYIFLGRDYKDKELTTEVRLAVGKQRRDIGEAMGAFREEKEEIVGEREIGLPPQVLLTSCLHICIDIYIKERICLLTKQLKS